MRLLGIAVLAFLFTLSAFIYAGDYKITKVIEVGPGRGPVVGTLKWSPSGDKLAYFDKNGLYISDTLGQTREVAILGMPGYRYEWLNDEEVVVGLHSYRQGRISFDSIFIVDVGDLSMTKDAAYAGKPFSSPDAYIGLNDGPWLTIEGNAYYSNNIDPKKGARARGEIVFPRGKYGQKGGAVNPAENHIVSWGEDGLYLVNCDLLDSTRIAPRPYSYIVSLPIMSPDKSYYMLGGTIYKFSDSTYIILDTLSDKLAKGTVQCDFMDHSFSPVSPEVIFQLICDDDVAYEVSRVGVYDLITGGMTIIDTLIGLDQCDLPSYNPDGYKIALRSQGKVYIVCRQRTDE